MLTDAANVGNMMTVSTGSIG